MPELRSGVRRSRLRSGKVDEVQAADRVVTPVLPAPRGRVGRRAGAPAAGRGNKKAPAAGRGRPAAKARGKGIKAIDLEPDQPAQDLPEPISSEAVAARAKQLVAAAAANLKMEGASGDRLAAAEDEATTTPVPERVWLLIFSMHLFTLIVLFLYY